MTRVEIESFDGVWISAYHSPPADGQEHVVIALPLATQPSFIDDALNRLARHYTVITWETRLILTPQVRLPELDALSIESHLEDVSVILKHFGIARASLIGYCSGASTALHIAAWNKGLFRKIALINGAYFMRPAECELTQYERDVQALVPQVASDYEHAAYLFEKFFARKDFFKRRDHEFVDEFYRPYENVDSFYRFGVCLNNFIRSDWKKIAAEIEIPAFVACGRLDDRTHYSSSLLVASQLCASKIHVDEDGDHYEFCRANPHLIDELTSFLSSTDTRGVSS